MQKKWGPNRWQEELKRECSGYGHNISQLINVTTHFEISRNWEQDGHSEERTRPRKN